jgi:hypothetical protein
MTERTTEAFKNLNALHRYDASSDANQPNFGLSCCRLLGGRDEGLRRSVSRDGRQIRLEAKVECDLERGVRSAWLARALRGASVETACGAGDADQQADEMEVAP